MTERSEDATRRPSWKYNDQAQWILERTDVEAFGDGKAAAVAYFDQLGRERRKRTLETHVADDTTAASETVAAIVADTVEGVVGSAGSERWVRKVSNPYQWGVGSGTDGWTATVLDRVGRVCAVEAYQGQAEPLPGTCLTAGTGHGGRTAFSYGTAGADTLAAGLTVAEAIQGVPVQTRVRRSDGLGRLVRVEEASGTAIAASTDYFYDAADRLVSVDQGDRDRSFVYLLSGWLKEATNPENGLTQYEYTDAGRLVKKRSPAGRVVCMGTLSGPDCTKSFDGAGRPLKKSYSDGTSTVDYVYAGTRLSQVTNGAAVVSYGHDPLDRVTARTQKRDAGHAGWTVTASYRPAGLAAETYPSGRVVSYAVDAVGRVTGVSGSKGGTPTSYLAGASYAPHGGMAAATIGGQVEARSWNGRLQPVGISRGTGFSLNYSYCAGQAAWCGDNNGNVATQTIGQAGGAVQRYGFDAMGRLASVTEGTSWSRTYGLDRYGNHWVAGASGVAVASFTPVGSSNFNAKNQLVIQGSHYDLDGQQDLIGGYGFTYDGEGRLATSTLNGVTTTNYYDGEGRRVKKAVIGETTSRTVEYVYGVDGELAAEYDTQGAASAGVRYPAQDHLGSTRVVFDAAGVAKTCLDYLPYGEPVPKEARRCELLPGVDLVQQVGVTVEKDEELHQRERRLGLAVLVTRKGIGAAAEDRGRLALVEREFLADTPDEAGIDNGGVHLLVELQHRRADPFRFRRAEDAFPAGRAELAAHGRNRGCFAFVGVGNIARVAHHLPNAAGRAFHGMAPFLHSSLNDTISASSMNVSFR